MTRRECPAPKDDPFIMPLLIIDCIPLLTSQHSVVQLDRERNQTRISRNAQCCQNHNRIPTCPKFLPAHPIIPYLTKELSIPLISAVHAHQQYACAICSEQRADGIELRGEDLEHDEREGELTEGGADIGAFEGSLRGANFDKSERLMLGL
jgi:hypothetical protein